MIKNLFVLIWALIAVFTFFAAIELQKQITADIEKRAEAKEFNGWCNVDFKSSKGTIDCNKISKLD
jgi:hypothetical protein